MYENSWELKLFLKQVAVDKKEYTGYKTQHYDPSIVGSIGYDLFKGNQFLTMRGITLWGFLGLFGWILLTNKMPLTAGIWISFILFFLFWFFFNSWLMHYFQVSERFIIVRNHNLPWINKGYALSDIREIVFETRGKMPNGFRVITKDFRSRLYPAATLSDRTWLDLMERLEQSGVRVRNESIFN